MTEYVVQGDVRPVCIDGTNLTYFGPDYAGMLRKINRLVGAELFPFAEWGETELSFRLAGEQNLAASRTIGAARVSTRDLRRLNQAIEQLHRWAEEPSVPEEKRKFYKMFRLPDPRTMPEAYRMTRDGRLHVLWGYEEGGRQAILPASGMARNWKLMEDRVDVVALLRKLQRRRLFRRLAVTCAAVALLGATLILPQPTCPVHGCVLGRGVWNYWRMEERCPERCSLTFTDENGCETICGQHLPADGKCRNHACKRCGKKIPLRPTLSGLCDSCFWKIQ